MAVTRAAAHSADAALTMARDGLAALDDRMCLVEPDGTERPLAVLGEPVGGAVVSTETITGSAEPVREIRVPYRGRELTGDACGGSCRPG